MKYEKLYKALIISALLTTGGIVVWYYWSVETIQEIKFIPFYIKALCFAYILLQILKRYLFKATKWWDWLYYIGLLSVVVPVFMINEENSAIFFNISEYGTLFLIVPAILDGKDNIQKN